MGFRSGLGEGQSEVEMKSGAFAPANAGLSVPCELGLSPAGRSSSVHGRGCCMKRHPNIKV